MTPNLSPGNRLDPTQRKVDGNGNDPNDPKHFGVVFTVVAEDDGEDDTAKVACSSCAARDDACSVISYGSI